MPSDLVETCNLIVQNTESENHNSDVSFHYDQDGNLLSISNRSYEDTVILTCHYSNDKLTELNSDSASIKLDYDDESDIPATITSVYVGKTQERTTIKVDSGRISRIEYYVASSEEYLRQKTIAEYFYKPDNSLYKINISKPDIDYMPIVTYQYKNIISDDYENPFVNHMGSLIYHVHMKNFLFLGKENIVSTIGTIGINEYNRVYRNDILYNEWDYPISFDITVGEETTNYNLKYSCK